MYCKNCGKELPDGSRFCEKCGAAQDNNVAGDKTPAAAPAAPSGQAPKGFKAAFLDTLKHPKKLIPTFVLAVIWLVFSLMSSLGANIPILRFFYALTYSNGGLYGGFFGLIGGVLGKALFAAFINFLVLELINKRNPFTDLGKGLKSITFSGLSSISTLLIGGGAGVLIYWFFNITSSPVNSAVAVVGAIAAIRAAGSQNGILFGLVFFLAKKLTRGRAPSRTVISRFLTGFSAGFALSFPITFARYPLILFLLGVIILAAGLAIIFTGGSKKAAAAMFLLFFLASLFLPFAETVHADDDYEVPYVKYRGHLTYNNGQTNKYGQPFPDLMDFDRDGDIDYLDRVIQHYLVHNPDYINQPQNKVVAVAVSTLATLLGAAGGIAGAPLGAALGSAASAAGETAVETAAQGLGSSLGSGGPDIPEGPDTPDEPDDLGPHITRDSDGDLNVVDPATGEKRIYISNHDGTYTNPLSGATYTAEGLKSSLADIEENKENIRRDAEIAAKAVEEQRKENQNESFIAREAREEDAAIKAKEEADAARNAYISKVASSHGVYDYDEKELKKVILRDQMEADQQGAKAMGDAAYADAAMRTAEQTEKLADKGINYLEKLDKSGTAKFVKNVYVAGKEVGRGLSEACVGEKSFAGAMTSAAVKAGSEITKNTIGDALGGGLVGFAAEGAANVTGDGVSATVDSLTRGKSLEDSLKAGSDAAKNGAINFTIDKTFEAGGGKLGISEANSTLASDIAKDFATGDEHEE